MIFFLFQGKSSSLSSETIDRARRSGTGLATKNSNQQANELTEIRKEIKKNLEKMMEENLRVCSSPLGSVSNLEGEERERQCVSKLTNQITQKKVGHEEKL